MKWLPPTLGTRGLSQDIRYGLRALKSAPGFTAVALISLTLGIGVATAAFSELNGFVLRDVPGVRSPGELVTLAAPASYPNFQRYRERSDLFAGTLAYIAPVPLGISLDGHNERMWGHLVTPSYFQTLGVRPALGRFLTDEDPIANVVVSYRFWQNHLGSDPSVIGRQFRVNGYPCTVIGVAPPEFQGASPMVYTAELWLPVGRASDLPIAPELAGRALDRRDLEIFHVIARLRPGVPAARAEAALDAIARQLEQENGDPNRDQKGRRLALLPGGKLLPVRKQDLPLLTGFMAVLGGMILLIASANVANMLLARAADRRREIAVRLALGAGRARLMRQLLAESMLIASAAGVLGFALATGLMHFASQEKLPTGMPLTLHLQPDGRVLLFALALTAFTGFAFGLAPAWQATGCDLTPALKEGGNERLGRSRRLSLGNLLVLSEVAGSLALLLITGFLVIGHERMTGGELGFDAARLYTISLDPMRDGYSAASTADFFPKLLDRVKRLPSVTAASLASKVPMTMMGGPTVTFAIPGPGNSKVVNNARSFIVGTDFFDTIGIPILRGRGFRKEDEADGAPAAIISEKMAQLYWHSEDPLGRRIEIGNETVPAFAIAGPGPAGRPRLPEKTRAFEVVGVARNVRDGFVMVAADAPPTIYLPMHIADYQRPGLQGVILMVRAAPGADALGAVRREIAGMDGHITPFNTRSLPDQIEELLFPVKVALWTYGAIGIFGLILASVGLAGVTAYSVTQRRREIGIRLALGARSGDVLGLVMKEGAVLIAVGSAIGLAAAWAGIRALSGFLSVVARTAGTSTADPALLLGAPLLLAGLALVACYLPARKSTRIDPAVALRQE